MNSPTVLTLFTSFFLLNPIFLLSAKTYEDGRANINTITGCLGDAPGNTETEYNYSSRFPVGNRNQGNHGLCWAHAGVELLEEDLCLDSKNGPSKNSYTCGQRLSVLDGQSCTWTANTFNEGGFATWILACGQDRGVCLDSQLPYPEKGKDMDPKKVFRALTDYFTFIEMEQEEHKPTSRMRNKITHDRYDFQKFNAVSELIQNVGNQLPTKEMKEEFVVKMSSALTQNADTISKFFEETLIPSSCSGNRIQTRLHREIMNYWYGTFSNPEYEWSGIYTDYVRSNYDFDDDTSPINIDRSFVVERNLKKLERIQNQIINHGRSLSISFCSSGSLTKSCGLHEIVLNGLRWNKTTNTCEVHLLNSWGDGDTTWDGWKDATDVLSLTLRLGMMR